MKLCPLCNKAMSQTYIALNLTQQISRALPILQCSGNTCRYWVPCNLGGKVPLSEKEQAKQDE